VGGDRVAGTDAVRQAQAEELVAFVAATHRPASLALVVGDLNVPAGGPPDRDLAATLGRAGLEDLWLTAGRGPGETCGLERVAATLGRLDPADPRFAPDDSSDPEGADGRAAAVEPPERIDRVFLQRPRPEHGVAVQGAVLRRRPFPRRADAPDRHRLAHLSDHLGLHLELSLAAART
jgi:endonuclease/exonuclease/phosphatase family metal-dependent hydrolase